MLFFISEQVSTVSISESVNMNVILTVDKTVWEICLSIAQSISQSMAQYDSQPAMSLSVSLSTTISSGKQNYYYYFNFNPFVGYITSKTKWSYWLIIKLMMFKPTVQGITLKGSNTNKQTKNKARQQVNRSISICQNSYLAWENKTKEIILGLSNE